MSPFGHGFVEEPFIKYVPVNHPDEIEETKGEKVKQKVDEKVDENTLEDQTKGRAKALIERLAVAGKVFAKVFETFKKAIADANLELPNSERVAKMSAFAEGFLNGIHSSQRMADDTHDDKCEDEEKSKDKGEDKEKVVYEKDDQKYGNNGVPSWDDDAYWEDKGVLDAFFEFERVFFGKCDSTTSNKYEQMDIDIEPPSFKLLNSQDFSSIHSPHLSPQPPQVPQAAHSNLKPSTITPSTRRSTRFSL